MPEEKINVSTGMNITDVKGVCDTCTTSCCSEAFGVLRDKFDMMTVYANGQTENIPALSSFNFIPSDNTKIILKGKAHFLDTSGPPAGQCPNISPSRRYDGDIYAQTAYEVWGFREEYSFKIFCGDRVEVEVMESLPNASINYNEEDRHIVLPDSIEGLGTGNEQSRFLLRPNKVHILIKGVDATPQFVPEELIKGESYDVPFGPDDDKARRSLHPQNQAQSANWSYPEPRIFVNKETGHKVVMIRKTVPVELGSIASVPKYIYHESTCPRLYLPQQSFGGIDWCREEDLHRNRRPPGAPPSDVELDAAERCKIQSGDNSWWEFDKMVWSVAVRSDLNSTNINNSGLKPYSRNPASPHGSLTEAVQYIIDAQKRNGKLDKIMIADYEWNPEADMVLSERGYVGLDDPHSPAFEDVDGGNLLSNTDFKEFARPQCFSGRTYSPTGLPSVSNRCFLRYFDRLSSDPDILKRVVSVPTVNVGRQVFAPTSWFPSEYSKFMDLFQVQLYDPLTDRVVPQQFAETSITGEGGLLHSHHTRNRSWSNITVYELENAGDAAKSLELTASLKEIVSVDNKHANIYYLPTNGAGSGGAARPQTAADAAFSFASFGRYGGYGTALNLPTYFDASFSTLSNMAYVSGPNIMYYGPDYFDADGNHVIGARYGSEMHILNGYSVRSPGIVSGTLRDMSQIFSISGTFYDMWRSGPALLPNWNKAYLFPEQDPGINLDDATSGWALVSDKVQYYIDAPSFVYCDPAYGRGFFGNIQNLPRPDNTNNAGTYTKLYYQEANYRVAGGSGWPAPGQKTASANWEKPRYALGDPPSIIRGGGNPNVVWQATGENPLAASDGILWYDLLMLSRQGGNARPPVLHEAPPENGCRLEAVVRSTRNDIRAIKLTKAPHRLETSYYSSMALELR